MPSKRDPALSIEEEDNSEIKGEEEEADACCSLAPLFLDFYMGASNS